MHSVKYDIVKNHYTNGTWDASRVRNAVVKDWITEMEFVEITGLDY